MKKPFRKFITLLVFMGLMFSFTGQAFATIGVTMEGYRIQTTGGFSPEWTTGNLGKSYDEGEWVAYQSTFSNIQGDYPGMVGMPDIVISWDFTGGNKVDSPRFGDLVRDIQVGTTKLTNAQGFPQADGSAYVISTLADATIPQNDPCEWEWTGFTLMNLPESQINQPLTGSGSVIDEEHAFIIHASDLIAAGFGSADTIYIYFQIHESRTFIWNNGLQSGYDAPPTDAWGGYLYSSAPYASDVREGSGFVPGSSGHVHNAGVGGSKDVPLPIPPKPTGIISGYKWHDYNADGIWDGAEPPIEGWEINIYGTVESISFSTSYLTLADGSYMFPALTALTWQIHEHASLPSETGWNETYPKLDPNSTVPPGAMANPVNTSDPCYVDHAAVGWLVTLTQTGETVNTQENVNFGNVNVGCLILDKTISIGSVVNPQALDGTFTLNVTGPGGFNENYDFVMVDGVITTGPIQIDGLQPGTYNVTETKPSGQGSWWNQGGDASAEVVAGDTCATLTVTNTFVPGCLETTKEIDFSGIIGDPCDVPNVDFTVTVTGPSYPSGTNLIFHLIDGVVTYDDEMDATACLCNLIPGNYYVAETAPAGWEDAVITGDDPAVVEPGDTCDDGAPVVTVTNAPTPGCLEITKELNGSGIDPCALDNVDFTVTVTGPSYPTGTDLIFHLIDGEVTYDDEDDATACLCSLIPGNYYVTETAPVGWEDAVITGDDPAVVEAGDECDDGAPVVTVTNTPKTACLEITKEIDFSGIIGDPCDVPDVDFTVTVTGPSYPGGTNLIFHLIDGVVTYDDEMDATACLCGLAPGDYYVTETAPAGWEDAVITGDDPAVVEPGDECDDGAPAVTVTNAPTPGCLEITKAIDTSGLIDGLADVCDVDFTVTVTGPSYPSGTDLIFHLIDGEITYDDEDDATACLCSLIPGDYYVTETAPAGWEDAIITGDDPAVVEAGDECDDGAPVVTVTNTPKSACLEITKLVDFSGIIGNPEDVPDVDFTVTVTGPSYPSGTDLIFHLEDGEVTYDDEDDATACLCGLVPGDYYVTETAPIGWEDANIVGDDPIVVEADDECDGEAEVTVTNAPTPGCLEITKVVDLGDYKYPDDVDVDFTVTITGPSYPSGTDLIFHLVDGEVTYDDELDAIACLCDLIPGDYTAEETAPEYWEDAVISGSPATVEAGDECDDGAELITVTNEIKEPNTTMQTAIFVFDPDTGNVEITASDRNTGDVPLTDSQIRVLANGVDVTDMTSGDTSPFGFEDDTWSASGGSGSNTDDIMDVGETWTWVITVNITETTHFEIWGLGTDPWGNPVSYNPDNPDVSFDSEFDEFDIEVEGLTRTQGFWGAHLDFTTRVLNDYILPNTTDFPDGIDLCWLPDINNIEDLMGVFWGNNAKDSNGVQRDELCKARMIASQQALAAILNSAIPGGKALPAGYSLAEIAAILCSDDIEDIRMLNTDLDEFNNSGEDVAFDPSLLPIGRANPNDPKYGTGAKNIANYQFADCENTEEGAATSTTQQKGGGKGKNK